MAPEGSPSSRGCILALDSSHRKDDCGVFVNWNSASGGLVLVSGEERGLEGIMNGIYSVVPDDLERLGPTEAVNFMRSLLCAEARSIGLGINKVHFQFDVNIPDGGIDGRVDNDAALSGGQGIIRLGSTSYQIKSGAFSAADAGDVRGILFKRGTLDLKDGVRRCFEDGGALVVVLTGADVTDEGEAVKRFRIQLEDSGYHGDVEIEIIAKDKLAEFCQPFPSLALRLKEISPEGFASFGSWSMDDDAKQTYHPGPEQTAFREAIRDELRRNDQAAHIQVFGEPGIGKSKLVFESVSTDDLSPLVIHVVGSEYFLQSHLSALITAEDSSISVILVLDECSPQTSYQVWNKYKHRGPRIKIITILHEPGTPMDSTAQVQVPPLGNELIKEIILEYGVPEEEADRRAGLCNGSPRTAHVLGRSWQIDPKRYIDESYAWETYITGYGYDPPEEVRQRRTVLKHIALFKQFGYGPNHQDEARAVAAIVEECDPSITWPRFQEIIHQLKRRRILQGTNTLYITPKALHIKLWADWWNEHGAGFSLEEFIDGLPPALIQWFMDMTRYGRESPVAAEMVKGLLGDDGPFADGSTLKTPLGARFFAALAEADPKSALMRLKNTVGRWSYDELTTFAVGRREIVWTLENIVVWRELFVEGASLLLALAEAENETWSNNATGVFCSLFAAGQGPVASTEAPPEERFPLLQQAIDSESQRVRMVALKACNAAFETRHFVRLVGPEHQGLRELPALWQPSSPKEVSDYHKGVWMLLTEHLSTLKGSELDYTIDLLIQRSREVSRVKELEDMVIETLESIASIDEKRRKSILAIVVSILHYEARSMSSDSRARWEGIRDALTGDDFHALLQRYVGMDLLEDSYDEEGNRTEEVDSTIKELAAEAFSNQELLFDEVEWLMTVDAKRGFAFGYELGILDAGMTLLVMFIDALEAAGPGRSAFTLSGYMRALFERNQEEWDTQLDAITSFHESLIEFVPELTWRSGMTVRAAERILELAQEERIAIGQFRMFAWGRTTWTLPLESFDAWMAFLIASQEASAAFIALDLFSSFYISGDRKGDLPEQITFDLLTHPSFLQRVDTPTSQTMDTYEWKIVGGAFILKYPGRSIDLAWYIIENFGEEGSIFGGHDSEIGELLMKIAAQHPSEIWNIIKNKLGPPIDARAYRLTHWLQGESLFEEDKTGPISLIPMEEVFGWVEEDVDHRAWYLATFVPSTFAVDEANTSLTRELLIRYGNRDDVRRNLMANFSTEGWTGPESEHLEEKRKGLLAVRATEENRNVNDWIDDYVSDLRNRIALAQDREEREDW